MQLRRIDRMIQELTPSQTVLVICDGSTLWMDGHETDEAAVLRLQEQGHEIIWQEIPAGYLGGEDA